MGGSLGGGVGWGVGQPGGGVWMLEVIAALIRAGTETRGGGVPGAGAAWGSVVRHENT